MPFPLKDLNLEDITLTYEQLLDVFVRAELIDPVEAFLASHEGNKKRAEGILQYITAGCFYAKSPYSNMICRQELTDLVEKGLVDPKDACLALHEGTRAASY